MAFHINNKGVLERCFAIFRKCPCKQHFETKEQGLCYIEDWDNNRMKYPALVDEPILEPTNKKVVSVEDFKDKSYFKDLYLTKDSFVCLEENFDKETEQRIYDVIKGFIVEDKMKRIDVGRGLSLLNSFRYLCIGDNFNFRSRGSRVMENNLKDDDFRKYELKEVLEGYNELWEKRKNSVLVATAFGYKITDRIIDRNTKIRIFSRPKPIEYYFEENIGNGK